jgi:NADH-quinone oxidoreductase subunit A
MAEQYLPVLVTFVFSGAVVAIMVSLGRLLGPHRENAVKGEAFECGNPASGSAWGRFSVKFYLTAILFIVFDVEVVFLYPWAVLFRRLGWFGFAEMSVFVAVLGIALLYVWRKGALEWD